MPIDFRCTQCQRVLRTPDDTAGKQAKCPECGTVMTIPAAGSPLPDLAGPGPSAGGAGGAGADEPPPGPGTAPGSPFGPPQGAPAETGNPYQSPAQYDYGPAVGPYAGFPPAGPIQPTRIDFGAVFGRTWEVFKQQWGMCLVGWMLVVAVNFAVGMVVGLASSSLTHAIGNSAKPLSAVLDFLRVVVNFWLSTGLGLYCLRLARGRQAVLGDLFAGGPYLLRVLGASILYALIGLAGLVLLVIPGVIWLLMFSQFYYLILDRNLSVMDALAVSRQLTQGNKLTLWAIGLVAGLLGMLLVLCTCGLGVFAVAPYFLLLGPVTYLAMSGQPSMADLRYGPPPT